MGESLKKAAIHGTLWSFIERFSVQGVSFIVMLIMARLLTPRAYGLVGMLTVFIAIAQSLVDSGFSSALIRKNNRTQEDLSTVFYFNIAFSLVLYGILYLLSPWISRFYNEPLLTPLMRVVSIGILINSIAVVQRALYTIKLDFKTQAKATFTATLISGVIGIYLAYQGLGVWAIVTYQLSNYGVNVIILWLYSSWRPIKIFSLKSLREMFGFGSKLALGGILSTIYDNLYLIVIGKFYKPFDVGLYTRAYQFASLPSVNISAIIQRVSYPTMCMVQDDKTRLGQIYLSYHRMLAFIIFPLMGLLIATAPTFVICILGLKWQGVIVPLQLLCGALAFYPTQGFQINVINTLGKSGLYLKIDIIKKIIGVSCLVITLPLGLNWLCVGQIVATQIAVIIHTIVTKKLLNISIRQQLNAYKYPLMLSLILIVITFFINNFISIMLIKLIVDIGLWIGGYLGLSILLNNDQLRIIKTLIKNGRS